VAWTELMSDRTETTLCSWCEHPKLYRWCVDGYVYNPLTNGTTKCPNAVKNIADLVARNKKKEVADRIVMDTKAESLGGGWYRIPAKLLEQFGNGDADEGARKLKKAYGKYVTVVGPDNKVFKDAS
jgi:hypothetical protein